MAKIPDEVVMFANDERNWPSAVDTHEMVVNGRRWRLRRCNGAAHSNPHIDNCMMCAPLWGVIVTLSRPGK